MSLWNWLNKTPKAKTPLLPKSADDVDASAARKIDESVAVTAESTPVGKRRGTYFQYDDELRTKIAKHACLHGDRSAARHFSKELERNVTPSTVSSILKRYRQHLAANPSGVDFLKNNRGRPLLLPGNVDARVQTYLKAIRLTGGVVNTTVAIATAMGVAERLSPYILKTNGGWLSTTSRAWGKSLLTRMNMTKRKATKSAKKVPDNVEDLRQQFTTNILSTMKECNIPPAMCVNFDETGVMIVPCSAWTMAVKGSQQVPVTGLEDKRQMTAVLGCSMAGEFLPPQLLYEGSTTRSHPSFSFPDDWDIHHSPNHWCNESTMLRYTEKVLVPFMAKQRRELGLDAATPGLVIMDVYRAHRTPAVMDIMASSNLRCVFVPANCTSEMQVSEGLCIFTCAMKEL